MKHKPQSLTSHSALTLLAVSAVGLAVCQITPISAFAQDASSTSADSSDATDATEPAAGESLKKSELTAAQAFEKMAAALDGADTLSCELHQNIMLSSHRFYAIGRYVQASGNRMKLDYKIYPVQALKAADRKLLAIDSDPEDVSKQTETGFLQQVSDGSVLWSYWINGPQKQLSRRNINEILDALDGVPNFSAASALQDLGVGGLKTLVTRLQSGMDFGVVHEQPVGNTKLLVLYGRWSEKTRRDIFKIPEDSDAPLPDYIPDYVRLYVDAASMLPRRIQYLKKHPNPEQKQVRAVVTLDLRKLVLNAAIADETFEFQRPEGETLKEVDLTAQVIDSIKKIAEGNQQSPSSESEAEDVP